MSDTVLTRPPLVFSDIDWLVAPYPTGRITNLCDAEFVRRLVDTYPSEGLFASQAGSGYDRLWLNPSAHPERFDAVMRAAPEWAELHHYITSAEFLEAIGEAIPSTREARSAYLEFHSMQTGCGARISPHTDISTKVASLIVWMMAPGEWDMAWGGGTDILRSASGGILHTFDYAWNAATLVVKTPNSWHGVRPIQGPRGHRRRTIDIILERRAR